MYIVVDVPANGFRSDNRASTVATATPDQVTYESLHLLGLLSMHIYAAVE
jgi:hypothetical protein